MDGVFEIVAPGEDFAYEFPARPAGFHLYHCHATPLKKHIHKGLYGAFIIDPAEPREPARELVLVMNGYDTDGDGENNFYTVNGRTFYYARYPIRVRRGELVRVYLANLTEFDLINSFHLHADFFRYQPTGTGEHWEYTDTVMQCQGQRGRARDPLREHRARSCSTRTSPSSPSSAGWATSRSRTDGAPGAASAAGGIARWRLWALVPVVLLAAGRGARRLAAATGSSTSLGGDAAAGGRVRRPPRRVPRRRDPHPRARTRSATT